MTGGAQMRNSGPGRKRLHQTEYHVHWPRSRDCNKWTQTVSLVFCKQDSLPMSPSQGSYYKTRLSLVALASGGPARSISDRFLPSSSAAIPAASPLDGLVSVFLQQVCEHLPHSLVLYTSIRFIRELAASIDSPLHCMSLLVGVRLVFFNCSIHSFLVAPMEVQLWCCRYGLARDG